MSFCPAVNKQCARNLVSNWLSNQKPFDFSKCNLSESLSTLIFYMKSPGILAGVPFIDAIAEELGCHNVWHASEGSFLNFTSNKILSISGPTSELIHGEHLIKTILSRACSIATFASRLKKLLNDFSWNGELISPSNNTPGFSLVEEYSMLVVDVPTVNSIIFQTSEIDVPDAIIKAIEKVTTKIGKSKPLKIDCTSLKDAEAAIDAGSKFLYFEGLNIKELTSITSQIKTSYPDVQIEVSSNFDESTLRQYAIPSIDTLSTKKLCNGYPVIDYSVMFTKCQESLPVTVTKKRTATEVENLFADNEQVEENVRQNFEVSKKSRIAEKHTDNIKIETEGEMVKPDYVRSKDDSPPRFKEPNLQTTPTKSGSFNGNRYNGRTRAPKNSINRGPMIQQRYNNIAPNRMNNQAGSDSQRRRSTDNASNKEYNFGINQQRAVNLPHNQGLRKNIQLNNSPRLSLNSGMMNPGLNLRPTGLMPLPGQQQQINIPNQNTMLNNQSNVVNNSFRLANQHRMNVNQNQQPGLMGNQLGSSLHKTWMMANSPQSIQLQNSRQCRVCGTHNAPGSMVCRNCRAVVAC